MVVSLVCRSLFVTIFSHISMTMVGSAVLGVALSQVLLRPPLTRTATLRLRWRIVPRTFAHRVGSAVSGQGFFYLRQASDTCRCCSSFNSVSIGRAASGDGCAMIPGISMPVYSAVVTRSTVWKDEWRRCMAAVVTSIDRGVVCGKSVARAGRLACYGEPYTQAGTLTCGN